MKRECPICRQKVRGITRLYMNLAPSMSQRAPAGTPLRSRTQEQSVEETQRRANPPRAARNVEVIDLAGSSSEGEDVILEDTDDATDTDLEYPDLDNLEYSDIEPAELDVVTDALARSVLEVEALRRQLAGQQFQVGELTSMVRVLQDQVKALQHQNRDLDGKYRTEVDEHNKCKRRVFLEREANTRLEQELETARAEVESLLMRKVATDIERILSDLTIDQAIGFGLDLAGMSQEQICFRMAALIKISKADKEQRCLSEEKLKVKSLELEGLKRKLRKLEDELITLREYTPVEVVPEVKRLKENIPAPANVIPKPAVSVPKPPAKFASATKSSFSVPDGTGGLVKKRPF